MISAGNKLQLKTLIDTCEQEKDISNIQTRGMLALLATCMLNGSGEEDKIQMPRESSSLSMDKCMEAIKSLEGRVQEKNYEIYEKIENNFFFMKNLQKNLEEVEKKSKAAIEDAKKELSITRTQVEDLRAWCERELKERMQEAKKEAQISQTEVKDVKKIEKEVPALALKLEGWYGELAKDLMFANKAATQLNIKVKYNSFEVILS